MSNSELILNTIQFVQKTLTGAEGGHDWFHIERVYKNALLIAQSEDVDILLSDSERFCMILQIQNFIMEMKLSDQK